MGCVRLYPDIIVAAEISSSIFFWKSESVTISIGNCLAHQKDYVYFGIPNAFIGFEGTVWNKNDYIAYFNRHPEFFTLTDDGYQVNLDALKDDNQRICYGRLLTQGTYSPKVLKALGLIKETKEFNIKNNMDYFLEAEDEISDDVSYSSTENKKLVKKL